MPPAVDTDPPPTNISASLMSSVVEVDWAVSTIANPPDRNMTEANNPWNIFSPAGRSPIVRGLLHSVAVHSAAPSTSRMAIVTVVSRVCRLHFLRFHRACSRFR